MKCSLSVGLVAMTLFLSACGEESAPSAHLTDLRHPAATRTDPMTMRETLERIKSELDLIDAREHFMQDQLKRKEPDAVMHRRLLYNMRLVNALVERNRAGLDSLAVLATEQERQVVEERALLKECEDRLSEHEGALAQLKVVCKEKGMSEEQLHARLSEMELAVATQEALVESTSNEAARVWYAIGPARELKKAGIIHYSGSGWARIAGKHSLNGASAQQAFVEADKRSLQRVPVKGRRANFITEHPEHSYRFVTAGDHLSYLEILDASSFWRFSNYLVLEVR